MDLVTQSFVACRTSLAAYVDAPDEAERWFALRRDRLAVARAMAKQLRKKMDVAVLQSAVELQHAISASGALDREVASEDISLADQLAREGLAGLVAAMLLVSPWQWSKAPAYKAVPDALWPAYTGWLFNAPQGFSATGQIEAFAKHVLRRLEELDRLVGSHRPVKTLQSALGVFASVNNCIPLYFSEGSLVRHMELRARLLTAWRTTDRCNELPARPRAGRRLRVGFINRHFGSQTETYTTLPTFEHLDPERFEVCLYAHHVRESALEKYVRGRAAGFTQLPEGLSRQLDVLRSAELDIAVFGTNVTAVCHEVTQLALHRVAPLQVVNNSSCTTTGLPAIDVYVSGTATEIPDSTSHFTERLALLSGPAHAFNYEVDRQEPSRRWSRSDLGLSKDAVVFVSAANYFKITPEMRSAWARLLAAVPGSRLVLHPFNPNWSSQYPIKRFRAEMAAALEAKGAHASQLVVSTNRFPSRADVKALLSVGDVYLDTFPFGGVNSLVDPLELGLPVVAWEGQTMRSRMGAALLRQLDLSELVVQDEEGYRALAVALATDVARREGLRKRIQKAMVAPLFLDSLAASDLFGSVLEEAYDELTRLGPARFRASKDIIRSAPDVPIDAGARLHHACGLLAAGRSARAVDYLLVLVNQSPDEADVWFELARALSEIGRKAQALQALEVGVQIDANRLSAWSQLAELAAELGLNGLADEARRAVARLADSAQVTPGPRVIPSPAEPAFAT